jgi:hypothetical protein
LQLVIRIGKTFTHPGEHDAPENVVTIRSFLAEPVDDRRRRFRLGRPGRLIVLRGGRRQQRVVLRAQRRVAKRLVRSRQLSSALRRDPLKFRAEMLHLVRMVLGNLTPEGLFDRVRTCGRLNPENVVVRLQL